MPCGEEKQIEYWFSVHATQRQPWGRGGLAAASKRVVHDDEDDEDDEDDALEAMMSHLMTLRHFYKG
jgi:hypothetical protein